MLAKIYEGRKQANKDDFEVIFVGLDRDEPSWKSYLDGHHPWLAVPYQDQKRIKQLAGHFGVQGIPSLIILDKDLKVGNGALTINTLLLPSASPHFAPCLCDVYQVINSDCVQSVQSDPNGSDFPWPPKPIADLSESTSSGGHSIGDKPALIAFIEGCDDDEQGEVSTFVGSALCVVVCGQVPCLLHHAVSFYVGDGCSSDGSIRVPGRWCRPRGWAGGHLLYQHSCVSYR